MRSRSFRLLAIDAVVNLALGLVLLLAPSGLISLLGLPAAGDFFYSTVLGAVLVGIGLALLLSLRNCAGLGLVGAIAINLCGSAAVVVWLVAKAAEIPLLGRILLWIVGLTVFLIALLELLVRPWRRSG